jgi:regulator of protease activity HflC (stomatin/prohibitin superfamily)
MPALSLLWFCLVVVAATIFAGVKTVPQGQEWLVERLGKYYKTLKPGLELHHSVYRQCSLPGVN